MKIYSTESPQEIEKDFNISKSEITKIIRKGETPPDDLFQKLDNEYKKAKEKYEEKSDKKNLLHLEHNYYWCKIFQVLEKDPNKSLSFFITALNKILERNARYPYDEKALKGMLNIYEITAKEISESFEKINMSFNEDFKDKINSLVNYLSHAKNLQSENLVKVLIILNCYFLLNCYYSRKLNALEVKNINNEEIEALKDEIKSILNIFKQYSNKQNSQISQISSTCYEFLYRIGKKQLHSLTNCNFREKSDKKKDENKKNIDKLIKEIILNAKQSVDSFETYIKSLPPNKQKSEGVKLTSALKEIDQLTAKYLDEAYSKKDILEAWKELEKIKQYIVVKAFKENVPLSDDLLKYFAEEWTLLSIFAKICLIRDEVQKRVKSLSQDWEKEVFLEIIGYLQKMEDLFKFEINDKKDYTLKIMTSTFAGNFSEYFIHELFLDFLENGRIDKETPSCYKELLQHIKSVKKEDIILNHVIEPNKPDIDIHIKDRCGIFLKNSKIESKEIEKILNEFELCKTNNINKIFYCINFMKNIENIKFVRQSFEDIRKKMPEINLEVFDIKDLIGAILFELKRIGKSNLNFSELDLYKVLDY